MQINLNPEGTWFFEWDGSCFILYRRTTITGVGKGSTRVRPENIGKNRDIVMGYWGLVSQVLQAYTNMAVAEGEGVADLSHILKRLDEIETWLSSLDLKPTLQAVAAHHEEITKGNHPLRIPHKPPEAEKPPLAGVDDI